MNEQLLTTDAPPPVEFVKLRRIEPPKKTFFYRKISQGELDDLGNPMEMQPFACSEEEAADLDTTRFQQIGVSDGSAYFAHLKGNLPQGKAIPIDEARRVTKEAFALELEVAKGHTQRPRRNDRFWGGASRDVANPEEARERFLGNG